MICRSDALRRIRTVLLDAGVMPREAQLTAARLVDEMYGILGAEAFNPRYGRIPAGYEAD